MAVRDFFTQFITEKRVVINSPWLRLPHLFLQLLSFLGIASYYVGYRLCFMQVHDLDGDAKVELLRPMFPNETWLDDPDRDEAGDERYLFRMDMDLPYCQDLNITFGDWRGGALGSKNWGQCQTFNRHELMVSDTTDEDLFFATRVELLHQRRCSDDRKCSKPWETFEIENNLVRDIEEFTLKIDHSAPSLHQRGHIGNTEDTQGFIMVQDEPQVSETIPCIGVECSYAADADSFQPWRSLHHCSGNSHYRDLCYSKGSDYISVHKMLSAANVSLDDWASKTFSFRATGLAINLEVFYTNVDPFEFWRWPIGPKLKYTYRFSKKKFRDEPHINFYREPERSWTVLDGEELRLRRFSGILIHPEVNGRIGSFSMARLFVTLLAQSAGVAVADFIVSRILIIVYHRTTSLRNVSKMYGLFAEDISPAQDRFDQVHAQDPRKLLDLRKELIEDRWLSSSSEGGGDSDGSPGV